MIEDEDDDEDFFDEFDSIDIEAAVEKFNQLKQGSTSYFSEDEILSLSQYFHIKEQDKNQLFILNFGLEIYPTNIDMMMDKASLYWRNDKQKEAFELLELAKDFSPKDSFLHHISAQWHQNIGNIEEAKLEYQLAINYHDDDEDLLKEIYVNFSQLLAQNNELKESEKLIRNLLKKFPKDEMVYNHICFNFLISKNSKKGIDFFKKMIDENPFDELAWYQIGRLHELNEEIKEAFDAFEYASLINPKHSSANLNLGMLYENEKKYEQAIESYKNSMRDNDSDQYPHLCIARCYVELMQCEMARLHLKQCSFLSDVMSEHSFLYGHTYMLENLHYKAIGYFKKSLKIDPDDFNSFKSLISCYAELNMIKELDLLIKKYRKDNDLDYITFWQEMALIFYTFQMDSHFENLLFEMSKSQSRSHEISILLKIIDFDLSKTQKNKIRVFNCFSIDAEATAELIRLFLPQFYENDLELKYYLNLHNIKYE